MLTNLEVQGFQQQHQGWHPSLLPDLKAAQQMGFKDRVRVKCVSYCTPRAYVRANIVGWVAGWLSPTLVGL